MNLLASIIIPTYNRSSLLNFTLQSILKQTLDKSLFETIVVDDGSSDDTRRVVQNYQNELNIKYYFQKDKGYRVASARNLGIMKASGELCLFIDSGVLLSKNCLKAHCQFYSENGPKTAVLGYVYGLYSNNQHDKMLINNVDPSNVSEGIDKIRDVKMFADIREKYYTKYEDKICSLPAPWVFFLTCNVSVSKESLVSVNMFDETYNGRWGCEDNDLGFRLHMNNIKIKLCRAAESLHYPHKDNFNNKVRQGYENCKYFNDKFNTIETNLFFNYYKKIAISESIDINGLLMQLKS